MFYSLDQINGLKRNRTKWIVCSVISFLIVLLTAFFLYLTVNDSNVVIFKVVLSIVASLGFCFIFYALSVEVGDSSRRIDQINKILRSEEKVIKGTIVKINSLLTLNHNIKVIPIEIKTSESTSLVYFDELYFGDSFEINENVTFKIRGNFVVEVSK